MSPDTDSTMYQYSPQSTPRQTSYSPLPGYEPRFSPGSTYSMSEHLLNREKSFVQSSGQESDRGPNRNRICFARFHGLVIGLTVIAITFSTALAFVQEGIMLYMMIMFRHTEHHRSSYADSTRTGPWAIHTKLWPTYLLLATSGVECILGVALLIATCCRSRNEMFYSILSGTVQFLIWAGVAAFYRIGKTGEDLWGWSCSHKAFSIQNQFQGVVDFQMMCTLQVRFSAPSR